MAKVLEDKVLDVDLNNLTKEDFLQMAHYIQHLEEQLEGAKSAGLTLMTQRNNLQKKYNMLLAQKQAGIVEKPVNRVLDIEFDLVNPEQYAVPENKVITSQNAK
jgi:carbohydrate-binding DOMON domain-containing protein